MSNESSLKCRVFGHDFYYTEDEKRCRRCPEVRDNDKQKEHEDPDAEIGDVRFNIEQDGDKFVIETQKYQQTASGPDNEYYQWYPASSTRVDRGGLEQLKREAALALIGDNDEQ